jgi:hypothetical protein
MIDWAEEEKRTLLRRLHPDATSFAGLDTSLQFVSSTECLLMH